MRPQSDSFEQRVRGGFHDVADNPRFLRPHDWQTYPTVMVCDPDLKASRLWGRLHRLGKDSPLWIKGVRGLK
jgi:hypothetical protein